jgi:S-methylmethionine-dependent homocysteine/selenocysteine methylase
MRASQYRQNLPQIADRLFITDGGIETTLIFHEGLELPDFAAFDLFRRAGGREALLKYFRSYGDIARTHGVGLVLETATWRANADWGTRLAYSAPDLAAVNRDATALLEQIRTEYEDDRTPVVISGCIGPRGDGYNPSFLMSAEQAEAYHAAQIETFADTAADLITAITMNYVEEAIGIVWAARRVGVPVVISFTVETDGKLVTGQTLQDAIERVDAETGSAPVYYMINCAHPTHFGPVLRAPAPWIDRIRGLRANASTMSHAELNDSPTLDEGDPAQLAMHYAQLRTALTHLNVLGGCCGTDHRHVDRIARACAPLFGDTLTT